jgi:hypothetical protein
VWDSRQVGGNSLIHLIRTHPKIWVKGEIVLNPLFKKPSEVLRELEKRSLARTG